MNITAHNAFNEIKPLCIQLSKFAFLPNETFDPNSIDLLNSLKLINSKLETFCDDLPLAFGDYVFIPISHLLKHDSLGSSQTNYLLLIISHLLRLCWYSDGSLSINLLNKLYPIILFLITENNVVHIDTNVTILNQLVLSLNNQNYKQNYFKNKTLPNLARTIKLLLDSLEDEKNNNQIELQLKIIHTLHVLYDDIITTENGETLSYVLPGNISSLTKLLAKPGLTINNKVIIEALKLTSLLLSIVYNDEKLNTKLNKKSLSNILQNETKSSIQTNNPHRNDKWLKATSSQVKLSLRHFIPRLMKRKNLHTALCEFISTLLNNCCSSLYDCLDFLLETSMQLHYDPLKTNNELATVWQKVITEGISQLPDMIRFDRHEKVESITFAIDSHNIESSHLYFLIKTITEELDHTDNTFRIRQDRKIIEQSSTIIVSDPILEAMERNADLRLLRNKPRELEKSLRDLIFAVGRRFYEDKTIVPLLNDLLSDPSNQTLIGKSVSLWVALNLLKSLNTSGDQFLDISTFSSDNDELVSEACYTVLGFCSEFEQELLISVESQSDSMTQEQETAVCTILSTIETVSTVMRPQDFQLELIDYIYIVIDNLASNSPAIRQFAQSCSITIASSLYNGDVKLLISENVDYLVDAISTRLNLGMTNRIGMVLSVICRIVGGRVIREFGDIIETIFKLMDYYHGYNELCLQFFQLFETIVLEFEKTYINSDTFRTLDNDHLVQSSFKPWDITNVEQLLSLLDNEPKLSVNINEELPFDKNEPKNFQEYFESKMSGLENDSDDEDETTETDEINNSNENGAQEGEEKWLSPIPMESYKILLQILAYGDRLLRHPFKPLRVQILKVIKFIIPLLATQYSSLLPQIAQSWDSIVECSVDKDFSIVKPACECLKEMLHFSGNFLSRRFIDLWEILSKRSYIVQAVNIKEVSSFKTGQLILRKKFSPLTKDTLVAMSEMLLEGISLTEMLLPESTIEKIILCCLNVIPQEDISSKSMLLADIVWKIINISLDDT
ncbi:hypothetical protein KAFR_0G02590 [Kazachstania africana CBS 2517]|uniref:TEL2-interacting protein 1 n=1 Tax=Kazachstania africana (strain ATCC 22294 / BCRC 22015 / CBS 2517 / CECT 1963 / NBRC 1671 / NRRL Y-8276) TaxID=1071382 RepID=H2AY41_KAZAF|nr:hypothetical protein KAFR_0G02590 [Kazachstania africana CBS 2517]CCF59291.1 hypothetical protein KAFR_0G02590 [Kazachstania africana CBS 2517]